MKPYTAMKDLLAATTTVTAIVNARRWHGLQPRNTQLPSLTFHEIGGPARFNGVERQTYVINNRAKDLGDALDLARVVTDLFAGASGTGTYGNQGAFSIARAFQDGNPGIIPEPGKGAYNVPVYITIIYPSSTVS